MTLVIKNLRGTEEVLTKTAGENQMNPAMDDGLFNVGLYAGKDNHGVVCGGQAMHPDATLADLQPACNVADYENTVQIPVYGNNNQYVTLKSGEEFTVETASDAETLFYKQMANDLLTVTEKGE